MGSLWSPPRVGELIKALTLSPRFRVRINGRDFDVQVGEMSGSAIEVTVDGELYDVELGKDFEVESIAPMRGRGRADEPVQISPDASGSRAESSRDGALGNAITALMPGRVMSVEVAPGDRITAGRPLLVVESMKMEQTVSSPREGVVASVLVSPGDAVAYGQSLIELE